MESLERFLVEANDIAWGWPMLMLLFGTHIFLTFRLRFIQRYIGKAIKISLGRTTEGAGDISQFGALATALAATIGTGNIVGVATAITAGGPGAVLWMWLTGVFGISTKYSEALLAVKYRVIARDGSMAGGPMYVLQHGMNARWLGIIFAALAAFSAFGIGNMVQSHSIATMINEAYDVPPVATGIVLAILTAAVILGGIKAISKVCERLVPFMAFFYVAGCLLLILLNFEEIPRTLELIVTSAFSGHAAAGGFLGAMFRDVIREGISKGLFSNESGLGSAPIVAAAARTRNPVRQALVSASGTFWDTVVVCAITGITLVNSGAWLEGHEGAALTHAAFSSLPVIGPTILALGLLTFAFSTILGWAYYGEKSAEYLFGTASVRWYRWAWVVLVLLGSSLSLETVWSFANVANALMALPNLISLLVLSGVAVEETRRYLWSGKIDDPADPPELGERGQG